MMSLWQLLFSLRGRIDRTKYLLSLISVNVLSFISALAIVAIIPTDLLESIYFLVFVIVIEFITTYILAAIGAKRLHDRNKSGWWILLIATAPSYLLVPSAKIAQMGGPFATLSMLVNLASFGLILWAWIDLVRRRGTPGENRFGPDPLAPTSSAPVSAEPGLA